MVFSKHSFFPHVLQHLVTHLHVWKQTEQVSNSFFSFSFPCFCTALTLDIHMERVVGGAGESCWICGLALCDACLHMIRVGSPAHF